MNKREQFKSSEGARTLSTQPGRSREPGSVHERKFTIRDIAREAGVSVATVSRAYSHPNRVREATRSRILAIAERHHFIADAAARGLARRRSGLIGLVIPSIYNSIYAASTRAIQAGAEAAGFTVLIGVSEFSTNREADLVRQFAERRVEGLILTGVARDPRVYAIVENERLPIVLTWHADKGSAFPAVSFDNYRAAGDVVDHLAKLGHRRIGLICGRTDRNDRALARREGFKDRMRRHALPLTDGDICECDFDFTEGRHALRRLVDRADPPTAIFSANDITAVGALFECRRLGIEVPADLSIVGFDDLPIAQYVFPQLTTVRVPAAEMGTQAVEVLLDLIAGRTAASRLLATEIIARGTTAPAAAPPTRGRRRG